MTKKSDNLTSMPLDDLWALHGEISVVLARRISTEKRELERRLKLLANGLPKNPDEERRDYPQVFPKFRNPAK